MSYEDNQKRLKLERWEADEYIVTLDGGPIGGTLSKRDGEVIMRWLPTALTELQAHPAPSRQLYILEPKDH